jgi:hypothetical protein
MLQSRCPRSLPIPVLSSYASPSHHRHLPLQAACLRCCAHVKLTWSNVVGGPKCDEIQFKLECNLVFPDDRNAVAARNLEGILADSKYARTELDNIDSIMPAMAPTWGPESSELLAQLPSKPQNIRAVKINTLGAGAFGQVSSHHKTKKKRKKRQRKQTFYSLK